MLVLVLLVLANVALCPHWPVKSSECTVESQGSWPHVCDQTKTVRMGEIQQLRKHTIMWQTGEMNPWKRLIILITKGLASLFYDTCDWQTIMYSLIPSTSQQPAFCRLNLCSYTGISRSKQEHVRFSLSLSVLITLHQSPVWQISTCLDQYVGEIHVSYLNALTQGNNWGNCLCCLTGFFFAFIIFFVSMAADYLRHFLSA